MNHEEALRPMTDRMVKQDKAILDLQFELRNTGKELNLSERNCRSLAAQVTELEAREAALMQCLRQAKEALELCQNLIRYNGHTGQHFGTTCVECDRQNKATAALSAISEALEARK